MEQAPLLSLVALSAGYLFISRYNGTRYEVARAAGYKLLFESAVAAVWLVAATHFMLIVFVSAGPQHSVRSISYGLAPIFLLATFFGAFLWGALLPLMLNRAKTSEDAIREDILRNGSEVDRLLYRAINSLLPILFTLKNEKFYVGWPQSTPELGKPTRDIAILPTLSGHRDRETKSLVFTTTYARAYGLIEAGQSDLSYEDFQIVLPTDEIRTMNFFSPDIGQEVFRIEQVGEDPAPTSEKE